MQWGTLGAYTDSVGRFAILSTDTHKCYTIVHGESYWTHTNEFDTNRGQRYGHSSKMSVLYVSMKDW